MSGAPGRFIGGTLASMAFDCTSARRKISGGKAKARTLRSG
jgi:hypothetical protein